MPSKHPSDPAAALDGEVASESEEPSDSVFDDDEKPTEPALQRSPRYLKVLVRNAGCVVRAPDDEE